jgi:hypothetical protein
MFEQFFKRPSVVARHANAPFADERRRYLAECARRGDSLGRVNFSAAACSTGKTPSGARPAFAPAFIEAAR